MREVYDLLVQTEDLRWFVAAAQRENVTAAAAELRVPQPTLSRALGRLEHEFGVRLFERHARGLRLNPLGQVVLETARDVDRSLGRAREEIQRLTDPDAGLVRLAFLHSVSTSVLPDLLGRFRAQAPRIRFELRQEASPSIIDDLRSGQAELGIIGPRPGEPGLGWCLLEEQRLRLAVPPGHWMAGRRRVALKEAASERFVVVQQPLEFRALTDRLCAEAGFAPTIAFESTDLTTIEALVGAGLGVALLPIYHGQRIERPVASVPLSDAGARRDIGLVWRREAEPTPAARRFRDFVVASRRTSSARHRGGEKRRSAR